METIIHTIISSVLKKCFDGFCVDGAIHVDTIGTILSMMGLRVKPSALKEIVKEIDADGSGYVSSLNNIEISYFHFCSLKSINKYIPKIFM